jgi:anti-sigma regulatory factor (Ser/Thr protein kinase)
MVSDLSKEEANNMEVWAEANRSLSSADENTDLNLVLKVINGNNAIPVIVTDSGGKVQTFRNIHIPKVGTKSDTLNYLRKLAYRYKTAGKVIRIDLDISSGNDSISHQSSTKVNDYMEICYDDSLMLKRLAFYPYIQLAVVLVFFIVALLALLSSKRAEQNKVWVGLSKETAHQLGTPISSLMAWVEILKENYPQDELIPEMDKDVKRLEMIAERFSKIGSLPEPKDENMQDVLNHVIEYISHRFSKKVRIVRIYPSHPIIVKLNASLFEWVIENLCKNAIDAMDGEGTITLYLVEEYRRVILEISDTGKGILKKHFHSVFTPGFTTKKRGWGLGLSLAKRIVEEYHHGHIYVKNSEVGKGTTFRVELKKKL